METIKKIINERLQSIKQYLNAMIGNKKLGYEKHTEKLEEFFDAQENWLNLKSFVESGVENHTFRHIEGLKRTKEVLNETVDNTIRKLLNFKKQQFRESGHLLPNKNRIKFENDIIEIERGLHEVERAWGKFLSTYPD